MPEDSPLTQLNEAQEAVWELVGVQYPEAEVNRRLDALTQAVENYLAYMKELDHEP